MKDFTKILSRVSYFLEEYTPYSEDANPPIFLFLKDKLSKYLARNLAEKISRDVFEHQLYRNSELVDIYLDLCLRVNHAKFYKCKIAYETRTSVYYVMYDRHILLIYFRKSEANDNQTNI